ncbi:uncharacterized protein Tco025E_03114 [Trypanosoma conorhini]|uniref:Transmembrane protein n=1 Tax=Trypanosoma conorhini TaxID=83891 RepID=A0A422PYF9_9TRYP|nr:uncharacterized protein Tco025E_03114 [Trypanosoma conorhini]RNF22799.1 hypothetical protein Tco025E_03114 [Trypanosoma conorhini]
MDPATGEAVLGGVCIGMWLLVTVVCCSRAPLLLEGSHHPLASPLVAIKVAIVVLLALWAFCYAGLGEFDLLFPDAHWRILPACLFYLLVLQFLRPIAVLLFCVVISTPASFSQGVVSGRANQEASLPNRRADSVATLPVDAAGKFPVLYLRREGLVGADFQGACSAAEEVGSEGQAQNRCGVAGRFTHGAAPCCASVANTEELDLKGLADTPLSTIRGGIRHAQLNHMIHAANVLGGVDGSDGAMRPLPGGWEPPPLEDPVGAESRQESNRSELLPGSANDAARAPEESFGGYNLYGEECGVGASHPRRSCCFIPATVGYWIIGRVPPEDVAGLRESPTERWSRLLLWRIALRMQSLILVWLLSICLSCVFVSFALTEEVRSCMERTSETAVCRAPGMEALSPPRLHLPRSLSIIGLIDNALLLLLWVICGVECLGHIGNAMTKQSFVRTYIVGALLLMLHTIYDSVELFDELRYNGLVTVAIFMLRNVCDAILATLLALRLGSGNNRMPRWYLFLELLWQKAAESKLWRPVE